MVYCTISIALSLLHYLYCTISIAHNRVVNKYIDTNIALKTRCMYKYMLLKIILHLTVKLSNNR